MLASCEMNAFFLYPCPAWLIKTVNGAMVDWIMNNVNSSLREQFLPFCAKESTVQPIIKLPQLELAILTTFD